MSKERFNILVDNYLAETLAEGERLQLVEMLKKPEYEQLLGERLKESFDDGIFEAGGIYADLQLDARKDLVKSLVFNRINAAPVKSVHRVQLLKTAWFRWAAVFILFIGGGVLYFINDSKHEEKLTQTTPAPAKDILPGSNKAILTLSNGNKIELDSTASETITDGKLSIRHANGQLSYTNADVVALNTMSTPKGGQYQLRLADGTKVWLNAASSITYPTVFTGNKREVKINGEVYFEVAENKSKPFIVDINGKSAVEVLGTSFNISSYANETNIRTTLIEGAVKVINTNKSVVLKPGQQAAVAHDKNIAVVSHANMDKTLAWKNGLFNFDGDDLRTVMRQLERWYDIEVKYQGPVDNAPFKGKIDRNVNLSTVLEMLQEIEVRFRLEGKTLIVL